MKALRRVFVMAATLAVVAAAVAAPVEAAERTIGRAIDDTSITAQVKAKLAADKLSNLTKIEVKTDDGVVTLNGTLDSADRVMRAEQTAASVNGVRAVVNNLHVAGTTIEPRASAPAPGYPSGSGVVDATGVVSHYDPASGTITLEDGRVLRTNANTVIWQPGTTQSLRPGSTVVLRGATPVAVPPGPSPSPVDRRMGTVRFVDPANGQIVLTDGTVVRVLPTANVHWGSDRIAFEQIAPGSEVVIRTVPPAWGVPAEGSALPGRVATIDATEVSVVWMPSTGLR
jgi:hyperosmotically inducible periplasmic protein